MCRCTPSFFTNFMKESFPTLRCPMFVFRSLLFQSLLQRCRLRWAALDSDTAMLHARACLCRPLRPLCTGCQRLAKWLGLAVFALPHQRLGRWLLPSVPSSHRQRRLARCVRPCVTSPYANTAAFTFHLPALSTDWRLEPIPALLKYLEKYLDGGLGPGGGEKTALEILVSFARVCRGSWGCDQLPRGPKREDNHMYLCTLLNKRNTAKCTCVRDQTQRLRNKISDFPRARHKTTASSSRCLRGSPMQTQLQAIKCCNILFKRRETLPQVPLLAHHVSHVEDANGYQELNGQNLTLGKRCPCVA